MICLSLVIGSLYILVLVSKNPFETALNAVIMPLYFSILLKN